MKPTRWSSCNLLQTGLDRRRLWQFSVSADNVTLQSESDHPAEGPLTERSIRRGWRDLFQNRLNLAWLPPEKTCLRIVHLPQCAASELPTMLELQIEKLSPLPVNQIVWSYEVLPGPADQPQTIILLIAARSVVEQALGQLEAGGYVADRLELPQLHWLATQPTDADGTWLLLWRENGLLLCLVAWCYGGSLQDLTLLPLPDTPEATSRLINHLNRISWAGEVEGWLTSEPAWHLITDPALAADWEAPLRQWAGSRLELHPAPTSRELATQSASRNARNATPANLVPPDFTLRYRQLYVDRLWMQGLGVLAAIYLLGVLAYFVTLRYSEYRLRAVNQEVAAWSMPYTNALSLKERLRVFQEQVVLKYAALDCWKTTAELLPPEVTLDTFSFQGGTKIFLAGSVAKEHEAKVTEFNAQLRKARKGDRPMFNEENLEPLQFDQRSTPGSGPRWKFAVNLKAEWLE